MLTIHGLFGIIIPFYIATKVTLEYGIAGISVPATALIEHR